MKRHTGAERRKGFRKTFDFGLDIVQVNEVALKRKWDDEVGVNIGQDGFCCCSTKQLPDGAQVTCLILFPPPQDAQMISAEAKLIWQKQLGAGAARLWYHGFEFVKVTPSHRKLIDDALKSEDASALLGVK